MVSGADLIPDPEDTVVYPHKREGNTSPRTIGSVMNTDVVSGRPESDLRELSRWLLTIHRRVMPIVDDDQHLVGVVARSDLMRVRKQLPLPPKND
jgi:CBS-domain-containing membrane protein